MVSQKEEEQIIALRKENMEFGKRKLRFSTLQNTRKISQPGRLNG